MFGIAVLGRNPQTGAAHQLIVSLEDNAFAAVPIDNVNRQVQGVAGQLQAQMGFNQKVQQVRSHVPLQLGLAGHHVVVGKGVQLQMAEMREDIMMVFVKVVSRHDEKKKKKMKKKGYSKAMGMRKDYKYVTRVKG